MKKSVLAISMAVLWSCNTKEKVVCNVESNITYSQHIAPIIETNCFECHAPDVYKEKASRNKIFNYEGLKDKAESGILYGSVSHQKGFIAMPYRKGKKIDTCDIATIKGWIDGGMKE